MRRSRSSSSSPAARVPWASDSSVALAQSWASAVCSIESLTPELLASSCPGSGQYSREEEQLFWSWVHQGYNAKALRPSEAKDAQTLQQQWEGMRPSVARFHAILTELWPNGPVTTLDALQPRELQKLLERAVGVFQERTGQRFDHLDVWNLLTHHEDWERVLKDLVLRENVDDAAVPAPAAASGGCKPAAASTTVQRHRRGHGDTPAGDEGKAEEADGASAARCSSAVLGSSKKQRVSGAKRRKKAPHRVQQFVESAEEVEVNERDSHVRYQVIGNLETEELDCGDQERHAGGCVDEVRAAAVVTPTHSSNSQRGIGKAPVKRGRGIQTARAVEARRRGQDAQGGSGNETPPAEQQVPQTMQNGEGLAMESLNQDKEEVETRVEAVHLALAWADVSCSCADMSPRLEESNKWFWFLVSSVYFDLVAKPDCRGDIDGVLKDEWLRIKECIAAFHLLYEEELVKKADVRRADREVVILRAQEAFWTQHEHWFQHRAAWEVLERHADWERVLRPLILGLSAPGVSSGTSSREQTDRCDETTRESSAEPNTASPVSDECGTASAKAASATCRQALDPSSQPSIKSLIAIAASEKSSALSAQWLEWITNHSDLQVMTQSEAGLSPEAVEYLHLRRQQILQKTRESK